MSTIVFMYVTFPSYEEAEEIVTMLLEKKLIACANMRPHTSMYMWDGEMVNEEEHGVLLKTSAQCSKMAQRVIKENHSYQAACVVAWPVQADVAFGQWVEEMCCGF